MDTTEVVIIANYGKGLGERRAIWAKKATIKSFNRTSIDIFNGMTWAGPCPNNRVA
ncbi:hypothetical protein [uncultured Winogradskyella sp.]|uniref:hypothetical protein n=1 Tax=uncultured Winogradskyella sp. TaxID=395353 RepID=UPI002609CDFA|nr:hypothetical protein [uncultured Winogradskyella sp.]